MPPFTSVPSRASYAVSPHPDPRRAGRLAAAEAASTVGRENVRALLMFASAGHGAEADEVARGAREHLPSATIAVVGGAGVLATEGAIEGASAVSALALAFEMDGVVLGLTTRKSPPRTQKRWRAFGEEARGRAPRPALLFMQPESYDPVLLSTFHAALGEVPVLGGGIAPGTALVLARPNEEPVSGAALALMLGSGVRLTTGASPAIRRLHEPCPIELIERGFVTRIGGRPPLEILADVVSSRSDRPLILAEIEPAGSLDSERVVRGITGVDPSVGGIHVGLDIEPGDRLSFAVVDSYAARRDLEAMVDKKRTELRGGVPLAAVYVQCAGRGSELFGSPDADVKTIRRVFGGIPFAGLHSSFELATVAGTARMHAYTGVLGLIYAPS